MGTVDIEETVEELLLSDIIEWDGEHPNYDEFRRLLREAVTEVTNHHYSMCDGEIDDWQVWEQDIVCIVNDRLECIINDE